MCWLVMIYWLVMMYWLIQLFDLVVMICWLVMMYWLIQLFDLYCPLLPWCRSPLSRRVWERSEEVVKCLQCQMQLHHRARETVSEVRGAFRVALNKLMQLRNESNQLKCLVTELKMADHGIDARCDVCVYAVRACVCTVCVLCVCTVCVLCVYCVCTVCVLCVFMCGLDCECDRCTCVSRYMY